MKKATNKTAFDSNHYDEKYYQDNNQSGDRIALHFYARLLKRYFKKGSILEYGCGAGFFLKKFRPPYFKQYAHDISEYALEQARLNNPSVEIITSTKKQIQKESLDAVAALHLLEHIEDPTTVLDEFSRILKKDGLLFVTMPNMSSVMRRVKGDRWFGYRDITHISLLHPNKWVELIDSAGFEIILTGSDGLWDVPYYPKVPLVLQKLIFYPTSAVQIVANRLLLPIRYGENLVIVARKRK